MGCRHSSIANDIICTKPTIYQTASSRTYVFDHYRDDIPDNYSMPEIQVVDRSVELQMNNTTPLRRRANAVDIPTTELPNKYGKPQGAEALVELAVLAERYQHNVEGELPLYQ
mmetsp:Transcript_8059/g.12325  ORF Transcript_8059/g.12325 Transcript_8059/m.12325 type:complete len:113 (+) Transcript_8059:119-457(+)